MNKIHLHLSPGMKAGGGGGGGELCATTTIIKGG